MPIHKALGSAEEGGALGSCDLAVPEGISKLVEVQDVIAISAGRDKKVDVEVMNDESGLGILDFDQVDVPPALDRALESYGPGQLDPLVEQQVAAINGRPSPHLILGENPHVVGDNLSNPPTGAPLTRAVEDPNILDVRRSHRKRVLGRRSNSRSTEDIALRVRPDPMGWLSGGVHPFDPTGAQLLQPSHFSLHVLRR